MNSVDFIRMEDGTREEYEFLDGMEKQEPKAIAPMPPQKYDHCPRLTMLRGSLAKQPDHLGLEPQVIGWGSTCRVPQR